MTARPLLGPTVYVLKRGDAAVYVGATANVEARLHAHRSDARRDPARRFDSVEIRPVPTREKALQLERELIAKLRPGLNRTAGGDGCGHADMKAVQLEQLARKAVVDPRTLIRALAGLPVRGYAGERAKKALIEAGFLPPEDPKK